MIMTIFGSVTLP